MKIQCPGCGCKLDVSELEPFSQTYCPQCNILITIPKWFNDNILLEERLFESEGVALYRSLEPSLEREAIVKVLKSGVWTQEQSGRFLDSARKQSLLKHPCIASVYSCGVTEEGVYVISQYTNPISWDQEELREPKVLCQIGCDLLEALAEALRNGVSHGHLCPNNILISYEKDVLITDFGAAMALGTKLNEFSAPEQQAAGRATLEGDIYSVGACLYYLATGIVPRRGAIQLLDELRKDIPGKVSSAIMKMLDSEPTRRPVNLTELIGLFKSNQETRLAKKSSKKLHLSGKSHIKVVQSTKKKGSFLNTLLILAIVLAAVIGGAYVAKVKRDEAAKAKAAEAPRVVSEVPVEEPAEPEAFLPAECLAARPRPEDLDFRAMKEQNKAYLAMVPKDKQDVEKDRLRLLGSTLDYLHACMKSGAYDRGESHPIRLKDGRVIKGVIPYAPNADGQVTIRRPGNAEPVKVKFSELDFMQIMDMFEFYAGKREDMALNKLSRSQKSDLYDAYLLMALLCDWYERPAEAKEYAAHALSFRPSNRKELQRFDLPVPPLGARLEAQ